jgi:hypothetical protein
MFADTRKTILFANNNKSKNIFDVDALAFIVLAGITSSTEKNAINNLYKNLKGVGAQNTVHNFYTNLTAFYAFAGGKAVSFIYNGKNPSASNPYNLTFSGGVSYSTNGAKFNGVNGFANTFIPQNSMQTNLNGFSVYFIENNKRLETQFGHQSRPSFIDSSIRYNLLGQWSGADKYSGAGGTTIYTNINGLTRVNRNNSTNYRVYRNGTQIELITAPSEANTDVTTFLLGAQRRGDTNGAQSYSDKTICYAEISNSHSLSGAQELIYYNCIQQYQIEQGRQV